MLDKHHTKRNKPERVLRDKYFKVPNELADRVLREVGPSAYAVFTLLLRHRENDTCKAKVLQPEMAKMTGLTDHQVRAHLRLLEDKRYIRRVKLRGASVYLISARLMRTTDLGGGGYPRSLCSRPAFRRVRPSRDRTCTSGLEH